MGLNLVWILDITFSDCEFDQNCTELLVQSIETRGKLTHSLTIDQCIFIDIHESGDFSLVRPVCEVKKTQQSLNFSYCPKNGSTGRFMQKLTEGNIIPRRQWIQA